MGDRGTAHARYTRNHHLYSLRPSLKMVRATVTRTKFNAHLLELLLSCRLHSPPSRDFTWRTVTARQRAKVDIGVTTFAWEAALRKSQQHPP